MASTSKSDDPVPSTSKADDSAPSTSSTDISKEILEKYDGNFLKILGTRDYVDKTELIRDVLLSSSGGRFIITAPPKFGKTNNLLMLKDFMDLSVKNNNKEHYDKLNISKYPPHFDIDYRTRPVLYIDLAAEEEIPNLSVSAIVRVWKMAIRKAYVEQYPALRSHGITEQNDKKCRYWCENRIDDINCSPDDLFLHLNILIFLMFIVHELPVTVLIDNYDNAINMTLQNPAFSFDEFKIIQNLTIMYLNHLLSSKQDVDIVVITGVSSLMIESEIIRHDNLNIYRFLDDHPFVEYFGLTVHELDTLLDMDEHKELLEKKLLIKNHYGGYNSRSNIVMFNPYSVMRCLKTKKIDTYWDIHNTVRIFVSLAASKEGRKLLNEYLKRLLPLLYLHLVGYFTDDYMRLKRTLSGLGEEPRGKMVSPYFFDHGILCSSLKAIREKSSSNIACLQLVNEEVYQLVQTEFQSYLIKSMKLPKHLCNEKEYLKFADYMNEKTDWLK